jgi:4-diphosphocytidyl-2-C-methyl-D-erythritol kinase
LTAEFIENSVVVSGQPIRSLRVVSSSGGNVEKLANLHNRLQEPAMRLCPQVAQLYHRLRAMGPAGCLMSGSGSSLFALCHDQREAERIAADLLSGLPPESELAGTRVFQIRSCS